MVTNISDNNKTVLYQFNDSGLTATILGNVITLGFDTTLMNANDSLQIFYDDSTLAATNATAELLVALSEDLESSVVLLKRIAKILEPISVQDVQQRQRVIIDNIVGGTITTVGTVTTVSTVTAVTNVQSMGGVDYRWQLIDQARNTYSNSIRANIAF